ncbi:hypothetical protein LCGC14_2374570, partial [marine sediment metagenome]
GSTGSTTTTTSAPSGSNFLRVGSRGQAVTNLQRWLADHGFNPGPIDGIFGPKTKAAVLAFQRAAGIQVDGIVGPETRGAMANWTGGTTTSGSGGGSPIPQSALAATVPAIRPAAAASRRARSDRERIAALASVRAGQ